MKLTERFSAWYWGEQQEPVKQTFASTPIADAIAEERYGTELLPRVSREEADSVPYVLRAVNLISGFISSLPLRTYKGDWQPVDNPLFRQIDPSRTYGNTVADTVRDLIYNKYAYWRVIDRAYDRYPTSAEYVSYKRVQETIERDGSVSVRIDGNAVGWSDVIKFESPHPAFLQVGGRVIRRAIDLDVTSAKFARNPRPLDYFTPADNEPDADANEIRSTLAKWRSWLRNYVTGYVPAGWKYVSVDQPTPRDLELIETQKQVGLSIANMTGLDPEKLGISTTSRTYNTIVERRQDEINEVYKPYMNAITERLTMGDVTKYGHVVEFDLSEFLRANPEMEANVLIMYRSAGLVTDNEIRHILRRPALQPGQQTSPEEVSNGDAGIQ